MWEMLGKFLNGDTLKNIGGAIGSLGGLYGAYQQSKMAKKNFGLQQDAYNYNKMLSEEERKRRDMQDRAINNAFANSTLNSGY